MDSSRPKQARHTSDADAFEAAIAAAPDDQAPRLVFADWLDERGDGDAAARQRRLATLRERIEAFVGHVDAVVARHYADHPNIRPHKHRAEFSVKWCRVVSVDAEGRAARVYCFVSLADSKTKSLGEVRAGDIHMAAGVSSPAKHARGSVFAEDFGGCARPHGVNYVRRNR
jgi:uncharacterized protein (TIGR02996 family)